MHPEMQARSDRYSCHVNASFVVHALSIPLALAEHAVRALSQFRQSLRTLASTLSVCLDTAGVFIDLT